MEFSLPVCGHRMESVYHTQIHRLLLSCNVMEQNLYVAPSKALITTLCLHKPSTFMKCLESALCCITDAVRSLLDDPIIIIIIKLSFITCLKKTNLARKRV